jgi:GrpB-like predicted nucleotidyltransferase (UPF0157 family)
MNSKTDLTVQRLEIRDYDDEWPRMYEREERQLRWVLGSLALRIEHVGSTAVRGLAAKPVIDVQVSVASLTPRRPYEDALAIRGYVHVPFGRRDARYPFFQRPARWPTVCHVHLCIVDSEEERAHLAFRDYLRDHPAVADEYAALKRRLIVGRGTSIAERARYSKAKTPFIDEVLRRAIKEGGPSR